MIITFPSALIFWLAFDGAKKIKPYDPASMRHEESPIISERMLSFAAANNIPAPLHVLVSGKNLRHKGGDMQTHVLTKGIPADSFVVVSGVPIIKPELCFLLAAKHLPIPYLALLATDLCGTYALRAQAQYGQVSRKAIASVQSISDYLMHSQGISGIKKAKTAICYGLDGAHSPIESRIGVASSLPLRYGGFATHQPVLNRTETLSPEGALHFGRKECCCDMVWEEERVIVEYDSDLVHSTQNQIRQDKKKMTALNLSDYKTIIATKDDFRNYDSIEALFMTIKKELGVRTNLKNYRAFEGNRRKLLKQFFLIIGGWNWIDWARGLSCKKNSMRTSD